jgi:Flp pilus assembly protein TadG
MVEFAIILPILISILFGIIEFGILLYDKAVITNASREGARAGILFPHPTRMSSEEIAEVVEEYCSTYLITFGADDGPETTTDPPDATTIASGDYLTVNVSYQYSFLVLPNFVTDLMGGVNLVANTTMRAE